MNLSTAMINAEHGKLVKDLAKPGEQILKEMDARDAHLLHMALGVGGEAGELQDAIKKKVIYRRAIDLANVIEELGDMEFYMEGVRQALNISREETLEANLKKLRVRYAENKYSDHQANSRKDKAT